VKTRYGLSPWIHQVPVSKRPDYPRFRGELTADVVIVGGGLTGCATAQACAAAGMKVIVLERDRVGQGSSGRSAGLLLPDPGPAFRDVAAAHGLRAARHAFDTWRRSALEGAALLRRLRIKCSLEQEPVIAVSSRGDEKLFRREYEAREAAGIDFAWLSQKQVKSALNLEAPVGVRMRDGFTLDPYRACLGMADAARRRKATFFERSPVRKVRFGAKQVDVTVDGGLIHAATIVVATGTATAEFRPLRRHFKRRELYQVLTAPLAAPVRKQLGHRDVILRHAWTPPTRMRWAAGDRLLSAGADQDETPEKLRAAVRVQRTGQLMYELLMTYSAISGLQPEYGWETSYGETADGLMYIGPHRNYPRHLFALGGARDSVTGSFLAARILLRALQNESDKGDRVFGWAR
jgi:glycine/D-amino acid oxidase-like deaminating enzyme